MSFKFATEASGSEYSYNLVALECSAAPEQTAEVTKACTKCGEVKGLESFHKQKVGKLGRQSYCRACKATAAGARHNVLSFAAHERTTPTQKHCPKCRVTKDFSQFSPNRYTLDTLRSHCKQCQATASVERRQRLTDTADQRVAPKEKQCFVCKETKNAAHFYAARRNPDTLQQKCKTCDATKGAAWRGANLDKSCATTARRKASKLQRTPPWTNKVAVAVVYAAADMRGLEVDHIVPLQGKRVSGLHTEANLQLLTKSANCSKGNHFDPDTYTHTIPQATGTESLALWACLAPHRTQTNGN
jgi:hypothetical protein